MIKNDERARLVGELFEATIAAFRYTAYRCGYAIGVHGTLKRDIDLMAMPWRDSAIDAVSLAEHLRSTAEAICGVARFRDNLPEKKPCGRLAFSFYLTYDDKGPYVDLSVAPKGEHN